MLHPLIINCLIFIILKTKILKLRNKSCFQTQESKNQSLVQLSAEVQEIKICIDYYLLLMLS